MTEQSDTIKLSRLTRDRLVVGIRRAYNRTAYLPNDPRFLSTHSRRQLVREAACLLGHEATAEDFRCRS